jgi:DNA-binding NarL/FixJ family response regulator
MSEVELRAPDSARRARLEGLLREAGHDVGPHGDVVVADLAPREAAPEDAALLVALSDDATAARDADIQAVLPRAAGAEAIDAAVRAVRAGLSVRPFAAAPRGFGEDASPRALLTPRELDILGAVGDGLSNKAVARRLDISAHTVKFHLEAIFAKLDARTRAEAVAKGLRSGLIEI